MSYQYFYITWTVIFLIIWLILFLKRKDLQEEMFFISSLFGYGGVLSESTHIRDWWQPLTLTGTPLGLEDFVIGFSIGGIASAIYAVLYHRKLKSKSTSLKVSRKHYFMGAVFLFTFAWFYLSLFYIAHIPSFYCILIACLSGILVMTIYRPDLTIDSLVSAISMLILGSVIYQILFLLYPDYIQRFWYLKDNWYSTLVLGVPLGEYIWFFLTGAFIGPLYEFVRNKRYASSTQT